MQEIWDAYDANFNRLGGLTLIRGERIPDGLFHMTAHIIVRHADGTYLVMKRANMKHFGLRWELTAGGSALQGEDALSCAKRELEEETGLSDGTFTQTFRGAIPEKHYLRNNYLFETSCAKDSVRLQEGETIDYMWLTRDEILALEEPPVPEDAFQWLCEQC